MRRFVIVVLACLLGACDFQIVLAPTPNLYRDGTHYPESQVAEDLRTAEPQIFFVTNRSLDSGGYGSGRSASMAFGAATVKFGEDLDWAELLRRTNADSDKPITSLWVPEIEELVRFEASPLPFVRDARDRLQPEEPARLAYAAQEAQFKEAVANKMRATGNRRLTVYMHGFNNAFDDSLTAMASLWHFSGRTSVPVAFTWPAGNGAGVLGYYRDRDAATFSVYHAKEFIRMLSSISGVEKIDIIAHSRGADLATSALRELILEARAAGKHPREAWKLGVLLAAAPDLGVDIVQQRLTAERFAEGFEQVNLYINPNDFALRLASLLSQTRRVGALQMSDFESTELAALQDEARVYFILVEDVRGGLRHSYFRNNPAVLSDIALTLQTRKPPGGRDRPMSQDASGVWRLHEDYPLDRPIGPPIADKRAAEVDAR